MRKIWITLLVIITLLSITCSTQAENPGKFIIILLDQLSLQEVSHFGDSELIDLLDNSAQALMNVRTDKGIESQYTYQAFGAGSRGEEYGAIPGLLGQTLKDYNLKAALYGNTDYGIEENREAVTIIMDENGQIDYGDISKDMLLQDLDFPGGWRTDYRQLSQAFRQGYAEYEVIVLEVGDIARIKRAVSLQEINTENMESLINQTLLRVSSLISEIRETIKEEEDQLMIVAPTPDQVSEYAAKLTWVSLSGQNDVGILSTATTRRPGLVTISDLAPTILSYFQISSPPEIIGRPIYAVDNIHGGIGRLLQLQVRIQRTSEWRPWYIKAFILIQIIILILATMTFFARKYAIGHWWKIITTLILGVILIPLTFLIFSPYLIPDFGAYLVFFVAIIGIFTWLAKHYLRPPIFQIVFITVVTVLLILIDIIRKSPWMSSSLLGYCPVIGARYYGIGNEFMGILIGGTLLGWTGLLDYVGWLKERRLVLTPLVFLGVTILIGIPALGANFGGTVTALAAFGFTYVLMFERSRRFKIILVSLLAIILFLSIIIISDTYSWTGERSHLGQTIHLLKDQGISALYAIISRKLSMNLKLLRWTIWTRVLLTFIAVLALLFKRPKGYLQALISDHPNFTLGFMGVILGSVITMMVNDSGVVAAATLLFFAVHPLIYLFLKEAESDQF